MINPKQQKDIFTNDVLDALPEDKDLKRLSAAYIRSQNPLWIDNNKTAAEKRKLNSNWSERARESHSSLKTKKLSSDSATKQWEDPEIRSKMLNGIQRAWSNPDTLAKKAQQNKEIALTSNWKEKHQKVVEAIKKPVYTDKGTVGSLKEAAKLYDKAVATCQYWFKSGKNGFRYLTPKESEEWKKNN